MTELTNGGFVKLDSRSILPAGTTAGAALGAPVRFVGRDAQYHFELDAAEALVLKRTLLDGSVAVAARWR